MTQETSEFQHLVGSVLAERYRINALLGAGGMGAVFDAEHLLMRKRVALKLLLPGVSQSGEMVARFEREAMAAANIEHPNVAGATDFGKLPDGSFYLVLEFVEGRNLRQQLAYGPLTPERSLRILEQVASALAKAHGLGIVHRDLKPENVMLVRKDDYPDFVKVLDFGIAKVPVESLSGQEIQTGQGLTRMGVMYGTPEYMAPEQAMGTGVDHRADLYALGVMLFEMITGERPFDAENVISLVTMHIVEPPPPLSSRLPAGVSLPDGVEQLVAQLLEKDRERRVQTARELADRIRSILGTPAPPSAVAPGSPPPPEVAPLKLPLAASHTAHAVTAVGEHGLVVAGPGATVQLLAPRWQGELQALRRDLEQLRSRLPPPLARLPLVVFPGAFAALLLLIVIVVASPRGGTAAPAASAGPAASAAPRQLLDEDIEKASREGPVALEKLQEQFPDDRRLTRALLRAYHEARRPLDAIRALGALAKQEKPERGLLADDLVLRVIRAATEGPPEAADVAFTLLEGSFGEDGIELLYTFWTAKKDVSEKTRSRAGKSLARPEVKERGAKGTQALIDLRVMPASCETRRQGVLQALEAGDQRAVPLLQALTSKRGCGRFNFQDCWGCLRRDNKLNDAIKAAGQRPPP
jgi:serine/threonine-protein kinase